jgi:hypothetical protein
VVSAIGAVAMWEIGVVVSAIGIVGISEIGVVGI